MADIKLEWDINMSSYYHQQRVEDLKKAIRKECDIPPELEGRLNDCASLLEMTESVKFDETLARKPLWSLKTFLETWRDMPAHEVWATYLKQPHAIINAWIDAWVKAQDLFEPDPAILPLSALTTEQRKEAETPGSPLT